MLAKDEAAADFLNSLDAAKAKVCNDLTIVIAAIATHKPRVQTF
jgi:hypothetical protein